MAEHECWIAAELTATGDADTVIQTVSEGVERPVEGRKQGEIVVLCGRKCFDYDLKEPLESVADHIDRLVFVDRYESGGGRTSSKYYTDFSDFDDPTDELVSEPGHWWAGQLFDYYTAKYDIDAAV